MSRISSLLYKSIYAKFLKWSISLFYYLPAKKNKIVMLHDYGLGYGDSPKYIAEELLKLNATYKLIWLVNNMSLEIPKPIKKVYLARIRSVYELATARVIITTMKGRINLKKKDNQFLVYIPHGQSGAKYVEKAAKELKVSYINGSKWHSSISDLFISSSKMQTQEMHDYFWYDGEIVEYGLPRNDIFFHYTDKDVFEIRKRINLEKEDVVVFYAPTFRNKGGLSVYDIDTSRIISTIKKQTHRNCKIIIRLHPNFIWYGRPSFNFSEEIIDVTDYPDIQELLIASEMLITDYSSTMFDFMLMKRPIFLFAKDIEEYQRMRGLKEWFFNVPFPICKDNDELIDAVISFDEDKYKISLKEFNKIYGSLEDGQATKRIVERIKTETQC